MQKIAILHPKVVAKGGAIKTLLEIGNVLSGEGNEVVLYTFEYDKENCFPELVGNVKIVNISAKGIKKYLAIFKLVFILRGYNKIIAGNSPMHFIGVLSKIFNRKSVLYWYLQNIPVYYIDSNKSFFVTIKKLLEKLIIRFIDQIVVNSTFIKNEAYKAYKRETKILYPSIDTDFFKENEDFVKNKQTLFCYSRLSKGKNVELAISTFINLQKFHPGLRLIIGGDGEEKDKLEDMAKIYSNIYFLGEIDLLKVKEELSKATIVLFTSLIDAFGITILESMSMQKPVVAMATGGALELIGNGENGYLAQNKDEYIYYIDYLLKNPELRKTMGNKGREWAQKYFSKKSFTKDVLEVF